MHNLQLDAEAIAPGQQKLVIVLPVDRPSHDLCKVVSSAVALGYPPPVLVNWKKNFHTEKAGIGPSHLAKASGTLDFLHWATSNDTDEADRLGDDDLVVMMDALDIWFQLPPAVLLTRYYGIVQSATDRLAKASGYRASWMRQTIVGAAQKGCMGPRDDYSNLHCDILPDSTLPHDVYGFWTDFAPFGWKWARPRYVNSGSFMGPVGDMKRYFSRVKEKMDKHALMGEELGGDQGVFSEVYGEQEVWRMRVVAHHQSGNKASEKSATAVGGSFDYHLTLDYAQELFYPTGYSENDGGLEVLDEDGEAVPMGIPRDIQETPSPLKALAEVSSQDVAWGKMSLFVDFWTASIPVAIHHNAWRHGLKHRRETWWDRMWFFPYLRRLLEAHTDPRRKASPVATIPASNGTELEVWPYGSRRRQLSSFLLQRETDDKPWGLSSAGWEETCKPSGKSSAGRKPPLKWYEEVFRDGQGAFKT